MRLHHFSHSSCSWRVRIALALKGITYESNFVNVSRGVGEQTREAYGDVNAMRQVPVLEWDHEGQVRRLSQSTAIIAYLDRKHPEPALFPTDALSYARAWQLAEIVNAYTQPLQNNKVMATVAEFGGDEAKWAQHFIRKGLRALEASVGEMAGRYCMGDSITFPDLFLVPQMHNAHKLGVDLAGLDTLLRIESSCLELAAFSKTHPDRVS